MRKSPSKPAFDFAAWQQRLRAEFSGLDPNDPSLWPDLPRYLLMAVAAVAVVVVLWYVWLSDFGDQLVKAEQREADLRSEYTQKLGQAVNREALQAQLEQVRQYVHRLEKQLPNKAEMDALLSDINQAGLGRSLQFELFRPGQVQLKDYYAELPIAVRVTGNYSDIGLFAADIANLSRIVTLNNLTLMPDAKRPGILALDATAKTFRYLDPEEVLSQQKAKDEADAKAKNKGGKKA